MKTIVINGLREKVVMTSARQDKNCHICKASIKKGEQYASIKFFISSTDRTVSMPVCGICTK